MTHHALRPKLGARIGPSCAKQTRAPSNAHGPLFNANVRLLLALSLLGFLLLQGVATRQAIADALPVTEISAGVFVVEGRHQEFSPQNQGLTANLSFLIGDERVAVIDTGGSALIGQRLKQAVRQHTDLPIAYVINTHMHPDHVFGNRAFADQTVTFVGHHKLPRALKARTEHYLETNKDLLGPALIKDVRIISPQLLVEDQMTIDLGGRKLILTAHKTAHTDNDLSVYDVNSQTLWLGDLLYSGHLPVVDGSILGWQDVIEQLRASDRKIARVVPGHGPSSLPWPMGLDDQRRYLAKLTDGVRKTLNEGGSIAEAITHTAQDEREHWHLFDLFHPRNVTAAYTELEWE